MELSARWVLRWERVSVSAFLVVVEVYGVCVGAGELALL